MKISPWIRAWHWMQAISVTGLLATFLLRKTFLSWRTNSALLTDHLGEAGVAITPELAKSAAKAVRSPMWEWHYIFGWILVALLVVRLVIALRKIKAPWKIEAENASENWRKHLTRVGKIYPFVYGILTVMAISGATMFFKAELGLPKEVAGFIKENHERLAWAVVAFFALHIVGAIRAELTEGKGIISRMINGGGD